MISEEIKKITPEERGEILKDVFIFGMPGKDGKNGENGTNGRPGKDGIDGNNGKDGKDGIDGKDGKNGKDGIDGKDGKDGKNGKDGKDGNPGRNGTDGKNGRDAIVDVQFSKDSNNWNNIMIEGTRYIKLVVNNKFIIIDFYKFTKHPNE